MHGKEFANYQTIEQLTGTQVYFAHAYSPHERGSNENRNRVLRRFIPKGQAIEELSDYQLVQINWYLNSRPLKCLNWHTPSRSSCLIYVTKFVQVISCNLPILIPP